MRIRGARVKGRLGGGEGEWMRVRALYTVYHSKN